MLRSVIKINPEELLNFIINMFTDIHSHLYNFTLDEIKDIIDRCTEAGVKRIITCVYNKDSLMKTIPILKSYKNIYLSMGVHPQAAWTEKKEYKDFIHIMEEALEASVAAGEAGYDDYEGNPSIESQREAFIRQVEMVNIKKLPLIIHCRKAFEELFSDLKLLKDDVKIIMHSYSGGFKYLTPVIKKGFYISFSGSLTFKRSTNLKRIAAMVPLNRILCETDSPFIPPETISRIDMSRPEHLAIVFNALKETREEEECIVKKALETNASSLFDFERIDRNREKYIQLLEKALSADRGKYNTV